MVLGSRNEAPETPVVPTEPVVPTVDSMEVVDDPPVELVDDDFTPEDDDPEVELVAAVVLAGAPGVHE